MSQFSMSIIASIAVMMNIQINQFIAFPYRTGVVRYINPDKKPPLSSLATPLQGSLAHAHSRNALTRSDLTESALSTHEQQTRSQPSTSNQNRQFDLEFPAKNSESTHRKMDKMQRVRHWLQNLEHPNVTDNNYHLQNVLEPKSELPILNPNQFLQPQSRGVFYV